MQAVLAAVEMLVARIDTISTQAAITVDGVDATCAQAQDGVRFAQRLEGRISVLLDRCEPLLAAVTEIDPALVRATGDLVTQLPPLLAAMTSVETAAPGQAAQLPARSGPLLDQLDTILMPWLGELHDAVPDVRRSATAT